MPPLIDELWPPKPQAIMNLEQSLRDNRPRSLVRMATGSGSIGVKPVANLAVELNAEGDNLAAGATSAPGSTTSSSARVPYRFYTDFSQPMTQFSHFVLLQVSRLSWPRELPLMPCSEPDETAHVF